jgi:hypothetical protein
MLKLPRKVMLMLRQWSREQDSGFQQLLEGKTAGSRLRGYTRGERVEHKFLLLAIAPFCVLMVSDGLGWQRAGPLEIWMWLSVAWAVFVIGYMFAALAKTVRRMGVRSDERYDREGRFLLPPEYRNTESATKAKRRSKKRD